MEVEGHYVTGMNNRVVWGLPHVFAVFLIVSASGALNAASISSVFGQSLYKPLSRISGLLAMALLALILAGSLHRLHSRSLERLLLEKKVVIVKNEDGTA